MWHETAQSSLERTAPTVGFVLIVTGDETSRDFLVRQLSRRGAVVAIAGTARQAQEACDRQHFDMVFVDPVLPDLGGDELIRILRRRHTSADFPIIAVTPMAARETIAQCLGAGANGIVAKPLESDALSRCVDRCLRSRRRDGDRADSTRGSLDEFSSLVIQTIEVRVVIWDSEDRLIACNRRYRDLFGESAHEVQAGASFERLAAILARSGLLRSAIKEPDKWLATRLARHRESGQPFEEELSDGSWARITEYHTGSGQIIGTWTDITDEKRREDALKNFAGANRQLAAAVNAATSAILITDARRPGNPTVFANPAFSGVTGWPVEEALGRDRRFLGGSDAGPHDIARLEDQMAAGRPFNMELRLSTRTGRVLWADVNASPIRDRETQIANWVIILTDASARKGAEDRLGRSRKAETSGRLTGPQARELTELLAIITGSLEPLLAGDTSSSPTIRANLETAVKAARRGSALADRLPAIATHHVKYVEKPDTGGPESESCYHEVILLVDQEPQVRAITSIQLRRLGYEVLQAENGPEALDLIESRRAIDLLVTDVDLSSDMTGVELAASIRGRNPDVRVLYVSGYADGDWTSGESPERRAPFLPKPYDGAALARAVRTALHTA